MAQRATLLGPKPSLFVLVCFVFVVFSFAFVALIEKLIPPRKRAFLLFVSVSFYFSLAFSGLPPFHFLFICLSLSLSLVIFFRPAFLSFFFAFFWFLAFCLFLSFDFFFAFVS